MIREKALQAIENDLIGSEDAYVRGNHNERRITDLMQEMVLEGCLKNVKRASGKQNREGIDLNEELKEKVNALIANWIVRNIPKAGMAEVVNAPV